MRPHEFQVSVQSIYSYAMSLMTKQSRINDEDVKNKKEILKKTRKKMTTVESLQELGITHHIEDHETESPNPRDNDANNPKDNIGNDSNQINLL